MPFLDKVVYGIECPVVVVFKDLNDNESASLNLELKSDGSVNLSSVTSNGKFELDDVKLKLGDTCKTAMGRIAVLASPYYKKGVKDKLMVQRRSLNSVASTISGGLTVKLRDKNSTILDIKYRDESPLRAEDILNTLVAIYNENAIKEKNQRMVSANEFIKDRLDVIEHELGDVENVISDYKSENLMPDVGQAGSMAMSQARSDEQDLRVIDDQIYMIRYIRGYLTDGLHDNQLLPTNLGLSGSNLMQQISGYNDIMLQRNNHLANSSAQNPLVIDLNQHLATMRQTIIQSLDNEQNILKARRNGVQSNRNQAVAKIASNPGQAKFLLSVERQQKVKESLYLFLLQKREENELSQAFTTSGSQLIELPHGSSTPNEPVTKTIYLIALCIGIGIPAGILFLREAMNTTVRGRKDLENLNVPFAGEIPLAAEFAKKRKLLRNRKIKDAQPPELLVKGMSLDIINEAFRIVRTNLEFILGYKKSSKVIMITSMNPGAGKTFVTANLAAAIGAKDKNVLIIDLDLRRGSLSKYVGKPRFGVSSYLSGQESDYRQFIVRLDNIDVLPCGVYPPNPTELLSSQRFDTLIEQVRNEYDYILIDCPPIEVVADAKIINRCVDMTLFVVRAQLFERSMLPILDQWYDQKVYNNMAVLLNGTEILSGSYGYHKYGYYGGYHYGNKKQ
jgi:capsular exopolysaccharide synthesis family protein